MVFSSTAAGIKKDFKELKDKVQKIDMDEVKGKVKKDFTSLKDKVQNIDMEEVKGKVQKDFSSLKDKVQNIDMDEVKGKVKKDFTSLKERVSKMVISLKRGQNISLAKEAPGMNKIVIGLGWNVNSFQGQDFDLDGSVILLTDTGKVRTDQDFVFYGNLRSPNGAIVHQGDNKTGAGDGDDEQIMIDLAKIDADVVKLVIPITIYNAAARQQNFGMVSEAYIRLLNAETQEVVAKYDLTEDYSTETALIFAEIYRHNNEWKIKAIGQGFNDGLGGIGRSYGLSLSNEK